MCFGINAVNIDSIRLYNQMSPLRHGISGIGSKVYQDLLHLPYINHYRKLGGAQDCTEFYILSYDPPEHFLDVPNYLIQIGEHRFYDLFPAEGKQPFCEVPGTICRLKYLLYISMCDRVVFEPHLRHAPVTYDCSENVIEVMSHAARKGPYALHLL